MKNTIKKLFVFLLPMFLVWGSVEIFYRKLPNNYTVKNEYVNKHSNEIETLLFGSSHCLYGLNPTFFSENTFNFSNVSQTLYFDKLLFENYMDKLPKLKQVVFCIEYTNLSQEDNTQDDLFRKYFYQSYMNLEVPIVSSFDPKKYSLALTRSLGQSIDLMLRYNKNGTLVDCDDNGYGNNYKKINRISPDLVGKARAKSHEDGLLDFTLSKSRIDEIIKECKKRNIKVLILSIPQSKAYTQNLNQEKLKLVFETCRQFELENKGDVQYLNLFCDTRFVDEDFYDSDHLNEVGAEKCSKIVDNFLVSNKLN